VGKPPYGAEWGYEIFNAFLKNCYKAVNSKDSAAIFMEKSIYLLSLGGIVGMILPQSFALYNSYSDIRAFLTSYSISNICNVSFGFEGVNYEQLIFIVSVAKEYKLTKIDKFTDGNKAVTICKLNIRDILKDEGVFLYDGIDETHWKITEKIKDKSFSIGKICEVFRGPYIPEKTKKKIAGGMTKFLERGPQVERYGVRGYDLIDINKLPKNLQEKAKKTMRERIFVKVLRGKRLEGNYDDGEYLTTEKMVNVVIKHPEFHYKYILALVNSALTSYFLQKRLFSDNTETARVMDYPYFSKIRVPTDSSNQAPIISLVDAIIQKKKEYHAISQNIEDYIDFEKANLIRLDEFFKGALDDFEVVSSLKAKHDNFDALRLRIEGDRAIVEYGVRRKAEDYEEIEEDEQTEVRGKYVVEWHPAGEGKIKDKLAVEFLAKMLEKEKRFSKAKSKTIWQKIAEIKVPGFTSEVKEGFLKYRSAMEKAKKLGEEITKIDRAIDRLVYDLYGLTEDEIKVVERSVWGEKFEEMYSKLPSRESALKLSKMYDG